FYVGHLWRLVQADDVVDGEVVATAGHVVGIAPTPNVNRC
ncbi:MAG: hypothetical protein QOE74_5274, partial [Mycobacterium sp.]|nr:hypothetical protein [Mycobacterium sp.]